MAHALLIQSLNKDCMKLRMTFLLMLVTSASIAADGPSVPAWFKPYVNIHKILDDQSDRKKTKRCLHLVDVRTLNLSGLQGNLTFALDELPAPTQGDNKPPTDPEDRRLLRTCGKVSDQNVNEFDWSIKPSGKYRKLIDANMFINGNMKPYFANDWEIKAKSVSFKLDEVVTENGIPKEIQFEYYDESVLVDKNEHLVALLMECGSQGTDEDYDEGNANNIISGRNN